VITNTSNNQSCIFNNVTIKDLKLIGQYEIIINSTGTTALPDKESQHEYISILTPTKFNMTVNLSPDRLTSAEIVTLNGSSIKTIEVNNDSIISFYNISSGSVQKSIPALLKSPEVKVDGHIGFKQSNFDPYYLNTNISLDPKGELDTKLGFVDNYKQSYVNGTTTPQYMTYLRSITINSVVDNDNIIIELPGDISPHTKIQGPKIPIKEALFSSNNIRLLLCIRIVTVMGSWLISQKKFQNENV
jgi:hypothetical protein